MLEAERLDQALGELDGSGIPVSVDTMHAPVLERADDVVQVAPAAAQRSTSAAISSGFRGTWGVRSRVGTLPVKAAVMISFSIGRLIVYP